MPNPITIQIDQATLGAGTPGVSREDGVTGELVTCSDPANAGMGFSFTWTLSAPEGSLAFLSDPNAESPTFTVDIPGAYLLFLTVTNGSTQRSFATDAIGQLVTTQGGLGVVQPVLGNRLPGDGETQQFPGTWQRTMDAILRPLDAQLPTLDEKGAMVGTDGTPSGANPFVTDSDSRLSGGGGGGTLDESYDFGGAGLGRFITADSGTVLITNNIDEDDSALAIVRDPPSQTFVSPSGLSITTGVNMLGPALVIFTETSTAENLAIEVTGPTNLTNDGSGVGNVLDVVRAGGTGRALAALSFDDTTHAIRVESAKALEVVQSTALGVGSSIALVTGADHGSLGGSGLDNTTWEEVTFDLSRTVTHTGGGGAFQYTGMRISAPTLQANAAQTISPATLVVTAPAAGTDVTFSEPWAIASGPMNIGRSDTASGETQDPGLRIERIPTTPLTMGQFIHSPHLSFIGIDDSDGTDRYHGFALQTQPDATPGARFALLYQQDTSVLSSNSGWSPATPIFSIEHTGDVVMTGPASVTLSSTTDGMTIAQSGDGHGLTFNSDTTPTRADVQFTLATANPTTLEVGTLWYVGGATNLLRYYDGTSVVDVGSGGGGGEINLGANVGSGTGLVFRDKTSVTLNFKSLVQGAGIALTNGADDITLAADMSMDETYDNGSTITVDSGAVVLDADTADTTFALEITREPTASGAQGLRVLMGGNTTGAGIVVDQNGTGLAADFNGDVDVSGKLTVGGLIDPTGLVLVNQASVPGGTPASGSTTLWVDSTAKTLMLTDDAGTDFDIQSANGVYVLQAEITLTGSDDDTDIELGVAAYDGDVIAITVRSDATQTAGDVTFNAQVAGATTISAVINGTNQDSDTTTALPGVHTVTAGDRISINVVEGTAFTPATTTMRVQVHLTNGTVTTSSGAGGDPVVAEQRLGTAGTSFSITGLDGDAHGIYEIYGQIIVEDSAGDDFSIDLRPNGLSSNLSARSESNGGSATADGFWRIAARTGGSLSADFIVGFSILFYAARTWSGGTARSRNIIIDGWTLTDDASSTDITRRTAGFWTESVTNLTSVEFVSTTASVDMGADSWCVVRRLEGPDY